MQASAALNEIPDTGLSPDDRAYLAYLQARISFVRGEQMTALATLEQINNPNVDPALRYRILSFQAYILEMQGDSLESAELADQILRTAPPDYAAAWKRDIWRNLERENEAELRANRGQAIDRQWQGWLDLAIITRGNTAALSGELSRWRTNYPNHPASSPLPGGLDHLQEAPGRGDKVALMLPLSGKLARA
jgi:outer membrane PBP1 activator LpoA protein